MRKDELYEAYYNDGDRIPCSLGSMASMFGVYDELMRRAEATAEGMIGAFYDVMPQKYKEMDIDTFVAMIQMRWSSGDRAQGRSYKDSEFILWRSKL